jgi:DNA-binding response OmpR family regulator
MESQTLHLQLAGDGEELTGLCLLVVEDDYLVAADMCNALLRRGAVILGPVSNARRGRELLRKQRPDCALLDLNLHGSPAFDLAAELEREGIPTILTTGYDAAFFHDILRGIPYLQKPVNFPALIHLIRSNASMARS